MPEPAGDSAAMHMGDGHLERDRTQAGDLSPIWRMLADTRPDGTSPKPVVVAVPDPDRDWRDSLGEAATRARESGATLIVAQERPLARFVLSLLARRRRRRLKGPSTAETLGELESLGLNPSQSYVLWPSSRTPRIAFPRGRWRVLVWAQRSGVLGGGGNRLWARIAARSPLFTPIALILSPGVAFVVPAKDHDDA